MPVLHISLLIFSIVVGTIMCDSSIYSYYKTHDDLASNKWEHFITIYDEIFVKYRTQKNFRLLEIGVQNGGSLQIWSSYFGPGSEIVGVDVDEKVCTDLRFPEGVTVRCMDVVAAEESALQSLGSFDVIIDDASHNSLQVTRAFERLFPLLRPGGVFVVEDIEHSYFSESAGGLRVPHATMEYFKGLTDVVNFYSIRADSQEVFDTEYVARYGPANTQYFAAWIRSLQFVEQMVLVTKRRSESTRQHRNCLTGSVTAIQYFSPEHFKVMRCFDEPIVL